MMKATFLDDERVAGNNCKGSDGQSNGRVNDRVNDRVSDRDNICRDDHWLSERDDRDDLSTIRVTERGDSAENERRYDRYNERDDNWKRPSRGWLGLARRDA